MSPKKPRIHVAETQEYMTFKEPRRMPTTYKGYVALAAEATKMRHKRKNALALSLRTQGFRRITRAFVPRSGGENTAIIRNPQTKLKSEVYFARQRVQEKYEDSDINPARIKQWALFSANNIAAKSRARYRNYRIDALMQLAHLGDAIADDGTVTYDDITASEDAQAEIRNYLVDVKIFVGDKAINKAVMNGGSEVSVKQTRRRWIARNHTRRRAEETEWAAEWMTHLTTTDIEDLYVEAFGNAWSRERFWFHAEEEFKTRERTINNTEPTWAYPPEVVYNDTPEAQGFTPIKIVEGLGGIALEEL